jgi:hypothetical protein
MEEGQGGRRGGRERHLQSIDKRGERESGERDRQAEVRQGQRGKGGRERHLQTIDKRERETGRPR